MSKLREQAWCQYRLERTGRIRPIDAFNAGWDAALKRAADRCESQPLVTGEVALLWDIDSMLRHPELLWPGEQQ